MNKKIIAIIILCVIVIGGGGFYLISQNNKNKNVKSNGSVNSKIKKEQDDLTKDTNSLVIYFSATGTTKEVASNVAEVAKASLAEIVPKEPYTDADLEYTVDSCRANQEQNDETARPALKNTIDVSKYDTIYLGYPIWWNNVPKIILTFLDTHDLEGKKIIPFCTSGSSEIKNSTQTLMAYNSKLNWLQGKRLTPSTSKEEIAKWLKDLKVIE